MVKFVDVDPADIDTSRSSRRGRVSYPIIKGFMERQQKVCKLDLTGLNKNPAYLRSVLASYVRNHQLPIRIFAANGDLHLMRLDLDNDNNPIPWSPEEYTTEGDAGFGEDDEPAALDEVEVKRRYKAEKGKSTK